MMYTQQKRAWYFGIYLILGLAINAFISCKKYLEVPPPLDSISIGNVFTNDETAIAAVTGLYIDMSKSMAGLNGGIVGKTGLSSIGAHSSDELVSIAGGFLMENYHNNMSSTVLVDFWSQFYKWIYKCNEAIERLNEATANSLSPNVRKQLKGELKFLRAFLYFYLTNLYGEIPLVLSSDWKVNSVLFKSPQEVIFNQIINDLNEAKNILSIDFLSGNLRDATIDRVRPTTWAASALLARVYLYREEYEKAETEASLLISQSAKFGLLPLNEVFLKNSKEAIWQLQPVTANYNTEDGRFFVIPSNEYASTAGPTENLNPSYLSGQLIQAFEFGDQRADIGKWIDTTIYTVSGTPPNVVRDTVYFVFKYKQNWANTNISPTTGTQNMTEYQMVLRLAEQYLIRAEARVKQGKINGARQDLIFIRSRAGLLPGTLTANDPSSLLIAIAHERRLELFCEWGDRWFDLIRTGKIDQVMNVATPIKSHGLNQWQPFRKYFPIPNAEIAKMINVSQNVGY